MKTTLIIVILLLVPFLGRSQSIEKFSIDNGGASASVGGIQVLYTIGEVNIQELAVGAIQVSEGFINPFTSCSRAAIWTASGWNVSPMVSASSTSVTLMADYNSATDGGSIDACEFTIANGAVVTLAAGDYIKVEGDITVTAGSTLTIANTGSLVQVDDMASVTNNGTISVLKTTPSMAAATFMISGSPMTGETREGVLGSAFLVRHHLTTNFVPHPDIPMGTENFADDNGNNWLTHTGSLNAGEGYLVFPQPDATSSGPYTQNHTLGTLNNGVVEIPLTYNAAGQNASPNILANPYASAIDADLFFADPANAPIDVLYFWEHLSAASAAFDGYSAENFSMGDISLWSDGMMGGLGMMAANGGDVPTKNIASGQGFAVKAASAGITATFNNAMRITGPNDTYRNNRSVERDLIRLNVVNDTYGLGSNIVIGFSEFTTDVYDQGTDVTRLATPVSLYSELGTGEQLAINALASFEVEDKVNLSFVTMVKEFQSYRITIQDLEGDIITNETIYIRDNQLNIITNLSEGDYTFESSAGTFSNRFTVLFENSVLGINDSILDSISLYPNPTQNIVTIVSPQTIVTSASVYDIRGRKVFEVDFSNQTNYQIDLSSMEAAVYFIEIATERGTITKRVLKNND